jgi:hypothetical protein
MAEIAQATQVQRISSVIAHVSQRAISRAAPLRSPLQAGPPDLTDRAALVVPDRREEGRDAAQDAAWPLFS